MATTGAHSRVVLALVWLVVGAAMVAVPVWLGWTRWQSVLTGHPAMLVLGIACGLFGFVALAWAVATLLVGDRVEQGEAALSRTHRQRVRRANRRVALAVPALFLCVLTAGLLAWARPFAPTPVAVTAMRSANDIRVSDRITWYEMTSVAKNADDQVVKPTVGLVFVPGARVDPRAYAKLLRPLAAAGYLVVVLKEPFGIAFLDQNHAGTVMRLHPEITTWVVAGHSLGGVVAASYADGHPVVGTAKVAGLALYASYPSSRLQRTDLKVTSISGSLDGLSTPAKVTASKDDLPAASTFVVVPGAVHSYFGDYGLQPGDGTPTADRVQAQAQITKATADLLAAVTPPKPKSR
ncbi:alpha/beta hydrolase [uncultured Friedmanniella sp.]|uniref:alpha/beta hydrolase n=1 Tax=uncultured Friedmanniella sp. TaxID=335381 RepID=UPI0035CA403E